MSLPNARNEADVILLAVQRAFKSPVWQQLWPEEQALITTASEQLASLTDGDDVAAIHDAIGALDKVTIRCAELMMEAAVTSAIRGGKKDEMI